LYINICVQPTYARFMTCYAVHVTGRENLEICSDMSVTGTVNI